MNNNLIEERGQVTIEEPQQELRKISSWMKRIRYRAWRKFIRQRKKILQFPRAKPLPQRGSEAEIIRLITYLRKIRSMPPKDLYTSAEMRSTRFTNHLRLVSAVIVFIIFVCSVLLFFHIIDPSHPMLMLMISYLLLLVIISLWMSWDIAVHSLCLLFFTEYEFITTKLEIAHDLRMAAKLRGFDLKTLKSGERWLEIKLGRLRYRLAVMFGNSDKIAIFTLATLVISAEKLNAIDVKALSIQGVTLSFVVGAVIGGILISTITVTRLRYQKEIVSLAIGELEGKAVGCS